MKKLLLIAVLFFCIGCQKPDNGIKFYSIINSFPYYQDTVHFSFSHPQIFTIKKYHWLRDEIITTCPVTEYYEMKDNFTCCYGNSGTQRDKKEYYVSLIEER